MHWVHVILEAWMFVSVVTIAGLLYLCRVTAKRVSETRSPNCFSFRKALSESCSLAPLASGTLPYRTHFPAALRIKVRPAG
jgi:hypothetical protein